MIRFIPVGAEQFDDLASVIGATSIGWKPTGGELSQEWANGPDHVRGIHLLAYDHDRVVGYGGAKNLSYEYVPGRFNVEVRVLPGERRSGIGSKIAARLGKGLRALNPDELVAQTDGDPDGERFVVARGFVEAERRYEQRLTPAMFDLSPGAGACARAAERCRAAGVRIASLESLRNEGAVDVERKLWALDVVLMADEPKGVYSESLAFDDWRQQYLEGKDPAGVFAAVHEDDVVGLTIHWTEPDSILIASTGVGPGFRRRGLAKALKLASVGYSRSVGLPLRTMNNALNTPILNLNSLCGFERFATYTRWTRNPAYPTRPLVTEVSGP